MKDAMIEYDWVYLCSDPRRLAITLQLLPPTMRGLRVMNVCWCSHLDDPFTPQRLENTAAIHAPNWLKIRVVDLSPLKSVCPAKLMGYFEGTGKPRWALGVKLLLHYEFEEPFLYTDDDVLVVSDPQPLMTNSFGTSGNFKFFKGIRRFEHIALNLALAFDHDITGVSYDEHILDAGIFFVKYPDDWSERLHRFASLPYLKSLDPECHEFRRIDQRFITAFGMKHGWDRLATAPIRRNCYSHPTKFNIPTLVKDTTFVHYKTGKHKADWMTALETYLLDRKCFECGAIDRKCDCGRYERGC